MIPEIGRSGHPDRMFVGHSIQRASVLPWNLARRNGA